MARHRWWVIAASTMCFGVGSLTAGPAHAATGYDPDAAGHSGFTVTPPSAPYVMAFHTCNGDCDNPTNHLIHLAQSPDGASWTELGGWQPYTGSVPDAFRRGNTIYVIGHGVSKVDVTSGVVSAHALDIKKADGSKAMARDTSFAGQLADGRLVIVYVPSMQDVAGATEIPVMAAVEDPGSDGRAFTTTGQAISIPLASLGVGEPTDPDVFFNGSTWVLYVSVGANVISYTGSAPGGPFTLGTASQVSSNSGGVASGISADGAVWTYVNQGNRNQVSIRRAVTATGTTLIPDSAFSIVLSGSQMRTATAESPGIAANVPGIACGAGCGSSTTGSSATPTTSKKKPRPGAACSKAGVKASFGSTTLTCKKRKGALVWVRS
ncbi:MAG: hypothetical protein KGP12_02980 [Actinomycetales bacterium]|nr:hypothetical protein [Actinomycetales bacterium]